MPDAPLPKIIGFDGEHGKVMVNTAHLAAMVNVPAHNRAGEVIEGEYDGAIVHLSSGERIPVLNSVEDFVEKIVAATQR